MALVMALVDDFVGWKGGTQCRKMTTVRQSVYNKIKTTNYPCTHTLSLPIDWLSFDGALSPYQS